MKRFNMIDEEFICDNCKQKVDKLIYTACPNCLYSKHVDINSGDRLNKCLGLLKPIGIGKYKEIHKNKIANDDNMDLIIELSKVE